MSNKRKNTGILVYRKEHEKDEDLIKRFRKKVIRSGMLREFQNRMFFEKPSAKRKRKREASIRAIQKLKLEGE